MFNENGDDPLNTPNQDLLTKSKHQQGYTPSSGTTTNSIQTQHKSLSFGNLSSQQAQQHNTSTHNLHVTSPQQQQQQQPSLAHQKKLINTNQHNLNHSMSINKPYNNISNNNTNHIDGGSDNNQNHSMSASMKNLKINQSQFLNAQSATSATNSNGDHLGGDNDSGISSMSSETAAAITSALNSNLVQNNSFNYVQKPIIIGQNRHQFQQAQQYVQANNSQANQHQQFVHRQIYQSNNTSQANISINNGQNTSTSSVTKTVQLETLV